MRIDQLRQSNGNGKQKLFGKFPFNTKLQTCCENGDILFAEIDTSQNGNDGNDKYNGSIWQNQNARMDLSTYLDYEHLISVYFSPCGSKRLIFIGYAYEVIDDDHNALSRFLTPQNWEPFNKWPCKLKSGYQVDQALHKQGTHRTALFKYDKAAYFLSCSYPREEAETAETPWDR